MPRESKPKIKKIREKKSIKERLSGMLFAIISLVLAGGLFIGLMFLQNYFSDEITLVEVLVAKEEVPAGDVITQEKAEKYFTLKSINVLSVPADVLKAENAAQILGKKTLVPLTVGETVSLKDFSDVNLYLENIEDPVEISLALSSIDASDGGKIREGDMVNITLMFDLSMLGDENDASSVNYISTQPFMAGTSSAQPFLEGTSTDIPIDAFPGDEESEGEDTDSGSEEDLAESDEDLTDYSAGYYIDSFGDYSPISSESKSGLGLSVYNYKSYAQYVLQNVYVSKALTSGGDIIDPTDTTSPSGILVFVIPKAMELELNNALENCSSMRVSKLLYTISPEEYMKQDDGKEEESLVQESVDADEDLDSKAEEVVYDIATDEEVDEETLEEGNEDTTAEEPESETTEDSSLSKDE